MPEKMLDRAVTAAFAGVELAEHKLQAFQYAIQNLRGKQSRDETLESALRIVWAALYNEAMEAYRRVFMWGTIVPMEARAEAKKIALKRFLHESAAIMGYLYPDGNHPSSWSSEEDKRFRKEIEDLEKKS